MADYSTYHSSGYAGAPGEDPNRQRSAVPAPYYNPNAPPGQAIQQPGIPPYGATQPPQFAGQPGVGYGPGPVSSPPQALGGPDVGGLVTQIGGLGISSDAGTRGHKKKHRHAHHDIGGPNAQGLNTFPSQTNLQSQFLNTGLNQPEQQPAAPAAFPGAPVGQVPANVAPVVAPEIGGGGGSVPTQGKIDPEQIPSVPRSRDLPAQYYFNNVYPTMERHVPPPASIPFIAHDQGNSSPKVARLTLNNIPSSSDFLHSTGLPLGMILQPLAKLDAGEQPVPVIDFGDIGPPRCRRCRTYINPFMTFRSGGNKFVCNMCTFPNDVPPEYFAPVDPSGVRVDRLQRPELMLGTVEFTVPKEYWVKEPAGLHQLFLIDVSQESVNRGFLKGVCDGIVNALYGEEEEQAEGTESETRKVPEGSKIGIVTFDREIHFYNLCVSNLLCNLTILANEMDSLVSTKHK
jgi:protein transport protein SEC24